MKLDTHIDAYIPSWTTILLCFTWFLPTFGWCAAFFYIWIRLEITSEHLEKPRNKTRANLWFFKETHQSYHPNHPHPRSLDRSRSTDSIHHSSLRRNETRPCSEKVCNRREIIMKRTEQGNCFRGISNKIHWFLQALFVMWVWVVVNIVGCTEL